MNKAIAGSDLESKTLEELVVSSWNGGSPTPVFNNAAQASTKMLGSFTASSLQAQHRTGLSWAVVVYLKAACVSSAWTTPRAVPFMSACHSKRTRATP
jgi:hypothetical protein